MTELINLTPHAIRVRVEDSSVAEPLESDLVIDPSGSVARVSSQSVQVGEVNGIPVVKAVFGDIVGLPEPAENIIYVTSMMVAQAAKRSDVVGPNTAPKQDIRYPEGHPLKTFAVRGFQQF